jgi:hypothetical protein
MEDFLLTTIAYGENYYAHANRLAKGLARFNMPIVIFTDNKGEFKGLNNTILLDYAPREGNRGCFSDYDKSRIAGTVLDMTECMWYIDCDWIFAKDGGDFDLIKNLKIEPGFTSCRVGTDKIHSKGYPTELILRAKEKYGVVTPRHHHEACYTIKKDGGLEKKFLDIVLEFGEIHDEVEISRGVHKHTNFISAASGVSFGYAIQAAGFQENSFWPLRKAFYKNFSSHLELNNVGRINDHSRPR